MIKFYYLNLKEFRRFFCSIIIEHFRMEITPNYANVSNVTLNAVRRLIGNDIFLQQNIKIEQNRTF
jgi:hypothetical protein